MTANPDPSARSRRRASLSSSSVSTFQTEASVGTISFNNAALQHKSLPSARCHAPRCIVLVLLLLSSLLLNACFGSSAPDRTYYSIDYPLGSQPRYDQPKHPVSLVLRNITTINAYDKQEIVYRTNPYEFQYYWYKLWASKPRRMLRELIAQHLRHMQIVADVTLAVEEQVPNYILDVEILALEELDVTESEWYAHMAMRLTLSNYDNGNVAWTYEFDARRPVTVHQVVYIVRAMSELMNEELTKAFLSMDQQLAQQHAEDSNADLATSVSTPKVVTTSARYDFGEEMRPLPTNAKTEMQTETRSTAPVEDKPKATLRPRR